MPTTTVPPTNDTVGRLAPGLTRAGIVNASALVRAHVAALNRSGYASSLALSSSISPEGTDAAVVSNATTTVVASPGWERYRLRVESVTGDGNDSQRQRQERWSNGTVRLLRVSAGNRTAYERLGPVPPGGETEQLLRLTNRLTLRTYLALGNYTVVGTNRSGGQTRYTLRADGATVPNVTSFHATAVVDEAGRVHRLNATLVADGGESGGGTGHQRTTIRYRLERTGVETVQRPAWADQALAATNSTG